MRRLTSIVALNAKGVIGLGNALPWRVKSDMRFFKEQTENNVVIMGRKTHDSLGRCLPNRFNVVVSHQFALFPSTEECVLQNGICDALSAAECAPQRYKEIFVIGGQSMYEQFAPFVDRYLVTIIDKDVPDGDAFFDQSLIRDPSTWEQIELKAGQPNAVGDEAAFSIFEYRIRDAEGRRSARQSACSLIERRSKVGTRRASARDVHLSDGLSFAF